MNDSNELLNNLRDVELPHVSAGFAPGWWLLALLLIVLCTALFFFQRRHRDRLWQRQAKQTLVTIREQIGRKPSVAILSSCSKLARKVVLAVDQRDQVANLHGEAWLEKLDDVCRRPEFTQGIGRLLVDQTYQKQPKISNNDLSELLNSMDLLIDSAAHYKVQNAHQKLASANHSNASSKRSGIASLVEANSIPESKQ